MLIQSTKLMNWMNLPLDFLVFAHCFPYLAVICWLGVLTWEYVDGTITGFCFTSFLICFVIEKFIHSFFFVVAVLTELTASVGQTWRELEMTISMRQDLVLVCKLCRYFCFSWILPQNLWFDIHTYKVMFEEQTSLVQSLYWPQKFGD